MVLAEDSPYQVLLNDECALAGLTLYLVPGLADDPDSGIRRGKVVLRAAELRGVFRPVIDEVITLVKGQVRATKKKVKAIILVGGFGQSAYLRDSIRDAVEDSAIEVLQSPNG